MRRIVAGMEDAIYLRGSALNAKGINGVIIVKKNVRMDVILSALFLGEGNEAFSAGSMLSLLLVSLGIFLVNYKFENKS